MQRLLLLFTASSFFLLLISSCSSTLRTPVFPTRLATVELASVANAPNEAPVSTLPPLPATFTVVPSATVLPTSTPLPSATPTFMPTATRLAIPNFLAMPVDVRVVDAPPERTPCGEQGYVFRSRFDSEIYGPTRSYHAYLPPCYGQDGRSYPVLYLFHGSVQSDSHWLDLGLARFADEGIRTGRYPPFIAVMPDNGALGNISSGGPNSIEGIMVNTFIPFVDATFCSWADAPGRAIGGISRGGYWALEIAFLYPELFGAVSGHSSHLRFETDSRQYNPLATYATADLTQLRIWLDWGDQDFLRPGQQQLHEALVAHGVEHEAHVFTGGHSDRYWQVHLEDYLDWHAAGWPTDRGAYPACDQIND